MKIVCAFGTRPDQIKMAPVVAALQKTEGIDVEVWYSGQGWDMRPAEYQYIISHTATVDWSSLDDGVAQTIMLFGQFLADEDTQNVPVDLVLVHGDDATAYACAVGAYLSGIRVGHVEAGLRTYAKEPYPEEAFRRMIACMADIHFAPDSIASDNLESEQINIDSIYVTGNTVIDTLPKEMLKILVTLHRRENWGDRIANALRTLYQFHAQNMEYVDWTCIRHPNWDQHLPEDLNTDSSNFIEPVDRNDFLYLLQNCDIVVTDSGGVQEEAAWFGKTCYVIRTDTEREALYLCGAVKLIDPDQPRQLKQALEEEMERRFSYGTGTAGKQIAQIIAEEYA